jgi:putative acetyltransferase
LIIVRNYKESDAYALWTIHFHTIRNINARDDSPEQVEAWAPNSYDKEACEKRMNGLSPFVAQSNNKIVGYTDLQLSGLIDHFFCHHEYQRKGVGRTLMTHVLSVGKERAIKRYYSEVSITARPFYEYFGFNICKKQEVEIKGQNLTNFVMEKFS